MFDFIKKKQKTGIKGQKNFIISHYNIILIILILLLILFGFYLIISETYDSLIMSSEPSPTDITSEQEKINIKQYESVYDQLQQKKSGNLDRTIPQLFN